MSAKQDASSFGNPTIRGVEMLPDGYRILPTGLRIAIAFMAIVLVGWLYLFHGGVKPDSGTLPLPVKVMAEQSISSPLTFEQALAAGRWGRGWRTFAAPLAIGSDTLMLFQRDGDKAVAWRIDWRRKLEQQLDLRGLPLDKERYTAVAGKEGVWLVGPHIALIRPDGELLVQRDFAAAEPTVVALRDGGVLVIVPGKNNEAPRLRRITVRSFGTLSVDDRGVLPRPRRYGYAATTLIDGRVMLAGGDGAPTAVDLYDPESGQWREGAPLPVGRVDATLLALPDGRAVIAGSGWSAAQGAHQVAVWEPKADRWQALPDLPLSLRVSSHGARAASGAVLPDGSLVFGGAMDNALQVLRAQGTAWAPVWRVVGESAFHRVGGVVQALGDHEVVVAGGVFDEPGAGGCCTGQAGVDRVAWTDDNAASPVSFALSRHDPVVAQRGSELLVTGGWRGFHMSFGTLQFSALAEIVDLARGTARQIAPLPAAIGIGQAWWLDADHALVKGVGLPAESSEYRGVDSRSLELREGGGALALYDRRQDAWKILVDPRLHSASLAGVRGGEAILFDVGGQVWAVSLSNFALRELPRLTLARSDGVGRVLPDGRIVVAGGEAQTTVVSVIDPDCDTAHCPDRYAGFGARSAADRYETLDTGSKTWRVSAPASAGARQAVILDDGRVVQMRLATGEGKARLLIERSNADGGWSGLPLPSEMPMSGDEAPCANEDGMNSCQLLLAQTPLPGGDLLFFRQVGQTDRHWSWEENRQGWLPLDGVPGGSPVRSLDFAPASPQRWRVGGLDLGRAFVWSE